MKRYLTVLLILVLLVPIASAGELNTPGKTPPPPGELDTPGLQAHGEQSTPGRTPPPSTDPGEQETPGATAPGHIETPGSHSRGEEPLWTRMLKLWLGMRNR